MLDVYDSPPPENIISQILSDELYQDQEHIWINGIFEKTLFSLAAQFVFSLSSGSNCYVSIKAA